MLNPCENVLPADEAHGWVSCGLKSAFAARQSPPNEWCSEVCAALGRYGPGQLAAITVASDLDSGVGYACSAGTPGASASAWINQLMLGETAASVVGLVGVVSAAATLERGGASALLRVSVAGTRAGWTAPLWIRQGLGLLTTLLAEAYAGDVFEPARRRGAILDRLQPAQREIVPLLADGLTQPEIAERIDRSRHTVHDHTKRIYHALGVHSRAELAALWYGRSSFALPRSRV